MIEFISLELNNFSCFKHASINLKNQGAVLVTGVNIDDPSCDSNMSGKSDLFNAIPWCLFGKSPKGFKGTDNIIFDNASGGGVYVQFLKDGKKYDIHRIRSRGKKGESIKIRDEEGKEIQTPDQNKFIEELLGWTYESFLYTVFMPQSISDFFISLSDAQQKEVTDQIIGTEKFKPIVKKIASDIAQRQLALNDIKHTIEVLTAEIAGKKGQIELFQSRLINTPDSTRSIEEVNEELEEWQEKFRINNSIIKEIKETLSSLQEIKIGKTTELHDLKLENVTIDKEILLIKAEEDKLIALQKEIKKSMLSSDNKTCPTCFQKISEQVYARATLPQQTRINELEKDINELRNKIDFLAPHIPTINTDIKTHEAELGLVTKHIDDLTNDLHSLRNETEGITAQISAIIRERDRKVISLKEAENKVKQIESIYRKTEEEILQAEERVKAFSEEIPKSELEIECLRFWEKGFGNAGIKSFMLDTFTPKFNHYANHYCSILTDGSTTLQASATSQLKSGEDREKFNVSILDMASNKTFPFSRYSGGYKKRLGLGGALGLRGAAIEQSQIGSNLFIADEIAENLDQSGVERLLEVLRELGEQIPSIFFITHNKDFFPHFQKTITVVMENKEGRIR